MFIFHLYLSLGIIISNSGCSNFSCSLQDVCRCQSRLLLFKEMLQVQFYIVSSSLHTLHIQNLILLEVAAEMNLQCKIGLAAFPWKAIILTDNGKRLISWYLKIKAFVQAAEESTKIWANVQSKRKISYPLVPWTSTILNLVVENPRDLVQKVNHKVLTPNRTR